MPRAPITGRPVTWREPTGHDDLLLAEGRRDLATAVRVVGARGDLDDAATLPVGDVDALIVALRTDRLGDRLIAEGRCARCAAPVDVDFSLRDYARHNRPRPTRSAEPDPEAEGQWRLRGFQTRFRLPTAADVLAAADLDDAEAGRRLLLDRCLTGDTSARAARAAERAMRVLGPTLRTVVQGTCPECAAVVDLDVDARGLCLAELGFLAGTVLDEVHLLAAAYHWSEREILDLPSARRGAYAERVRVGRVAVGVEG